MPYRPPEPIARALIAERFLIAEVVANAIDFSFRSAFGALLRDVGEVEKLIYFFMEGLPVIENGVNQLLAKHHIELTISGIFCHQTPKVKGTLPSLQPRSCELGDIAFIATYDQPVGPAGDGWGNAALFQAKDGFYHGVSPVQEELYETCTEFEYASPIPLTKQMRVLSDARGCLYYWDMETSYPRSTRYRARTALSSTGAILARPKSVSGMCFSDAFECMLVDMFCGIAGRGFQVNPLGSGWSKIIHDLIQNSSTRSIRHARIISSRKSKPSRLFNYVKLIPLQGPAPSFVRCSLGEFLQIFPKSALHAVAEQLEAESEMFDWSNEEKNSQSDYDYNGKEPPPLNRGSDENDGSGGGSFVAFQFRKLKG